MSKQTFGQSEATATVELLLCSWLPGSFVGWIQAQNTHKTDLELLSHLKLPNYLLILLQSHMFLSFKLSFGLRPCDKLKR